MFILYLLHYGLPDFSTRVQQQILPKLEEYINFPTILKERIK